MDYAGNDSAGYTKEDDERVVVTVRLGAEENGKFVEKYRYALSAEEGRHTYAIRVSNDYYWYAENIDTIVLDCEAKLYNVGMRILKGD